MINFYPKLLSIALMLPIGAVAQTSAGLQVVEQTLQDPENQPRPVFPIPSKRQMMWHETEYYAFFHYGMNTYTGLEWGYGNEDVKRFAPTAAPNPRQWVQAAKKAGMRGGIAVVKHHDGFCLWPTSTTDHNVSNSGGLGASVNIPRDFAAASEAEGMKYGFYISPWDRNSAYYGDGTNRYVTDVFLKQVEEISQYGNDQFEMWFDGANGGNGWYGGANTTRSIDEDTYYDKPNTLDAIHKYQPNCVVWGPQGEARWIGNEHGYAGVTNWNNTYYLQNANGNNGHQEGWGWFPGESDAKATSHGWFWHEGERVTSAERLFQMYLETVGRNATLILNFPPDKTGSLPAATVARMEELGRMLYNRLGNDLARKAGVTIEASNTREPGVTRTYEARNIIDGDSTTYWAPVDGAVTNNVITITWPENVIARYVALQEYIRLGQRVKNFKIEVSTDGTNFTQKAADICTTIGYKRIIPLNGMTNRSYDGGTSIKALRITLLDGRSIPTLHTVAVY
ncbi:MAG: alpha-L-fucosidase [Bacteroidales bacterium]|nr:alpha-L-fucosidase [Bacteroidales bacterium]